MLLTEDSRETYERMIDLVIPELKRKGYQNFKADHPDYEKPGAFTLRGNESVQYMPDISAKKSGLTAFIEISSKTENTEQLVSKWKLLSKLVAIKQGVFAIIVPKGTIKFTREIMEKYDIEAELIRV